MPTQDYTFYLALGDSLSIDKYAGPGLGAAALLYQNKDQLYPEFASHDLLTLNRSCRFENRAADGNTCQEVEEALATLPAVQGRVLVTLTVGGNDLIACFNRGSLDPTPVLERLGRLVASIRARFSQLTLLLTTVYDPTDGTGQVQSGHRRFAPALPVLAEYNARLRQLDVQLVDIAAHFRGHGMRHDDLTYEHYHPTDPSGWFCFDIEPSVRGSSEIRRLFWEALP